MATDFSSYRTRQRINSALLIVFNTRPVATSVFGFLATDISTLDVTRWTVRTAGFQIC